MYNFLFAFFYFYYIRFKDGAPNNSAIIVVVLYQSIHTLCLVFLILRIFDLEGNFIEPIKGLEPILYGLPMVPFFIFNFIYYSKKKREQVLSKYSRTKIINTQNIIIVFAAILIPIAYIIIISPKI